MIDDSEKRIENKDVENNRLKNSSQQDDIVSGLVYVRESHRIGFGLPSVTNNIGLVVGALENGEPKWTVKKEVDVAPAGQRLEEAWKLLFPTDSSLSDDDFFQKLRSRVPKLDNNFLENAWRACQFEFAFSNEREMGKNEYQLFVYLLFCLLFKSAAQGSEMEYRSSQRLHSTLSLQCKLKEEDNFDPVANKIWSYPDAAVTLYEGWDTFGMMEIKPSVACNDDAYLLDNDQCVLMTALTAVAVGKIIKANKKKKRKESKNSERKDNNLEGEYAKVAIPFVIVTGKSCSLYVTVLNKNGRPRVQVVGYPVVGDGRYQNFSESPSLSRKKMFAALAILLNNFREFFDDEISETYRDAVLHKISKMKGVRDFPLRRSSKQDSMSGSEYQSYLNPGRNLPEERSIEAAALDAARCGGMFYSVKYPFERYLTFTETELMSEEQTKSPFYFRCCHVSSTKITTNQIFLKVWEVEETNVHSVELESMHHRMAFEAGVPVAAPVFHDIAWSKSSCGIEFLVFAVEYIPQDRIEDPQDFLHFCFALVYTVMALHEYAKLLHCDLKPENIRWSNRTVCLIDFDRAQNIPTATWTPGTQGYEAPEIEKRLPCSPKTDSFSVGRIILTMLKRLERMWQVEERQPSSICSTLREIANNLAASDHDSRWSLAKAAKELMEVTQSGSPNKSSPVDKDIQAAVTPVVLSQNQP